MNGMTTSMIVCRYAYMIDNIALLITGTLRQRPVNDLLPRCHPLGIFEQLGAITIADTTGQLFNAVLVDTPLGKFFSSIHESSVDNF